MEGLKAMKFTKMQGTGNDFIVIENFDEKIQEEELAIKLCDRHFGIGSDGILYVKNSKIADIKMTIINSDGSYASMCGNGIRCFAKYVWDKNIVKKDKIKIETGDGVKEAILNLENNKVKEVTINMGIPSFNPKDIPATLDHEIIDYPIWIKGKSYKINSLLMGVPHTVILGQLSDFSLEQGENIEKLDIFPKGTNVNFCQIVDKNHIKVRTWERGAGITLACGTGSCASCIVANKKGLISNNVSVEVLGGKLNIYILENGVLMKGEATTVFEGTVE